MAGKRQTNHWNEYRLNRCNGLILRHRNPAKIKPGIADKPIWSPDIAIRWDKPFCASSCWSSTSIKLLSPIAKAINEPLIADWLLLFLDFCSRLIGLTIFSTKKSLINAL